MVRYVVIRKRFYLSNHLMCMVERKSELQYCKDGTDTDSLNQILRILGKS